VISLQTWMQQKLLVLSPQYPPSNVVVLEMLIRLHEGTMKWADSCMACRRS